MTATPPRTVDRVRTGLPLPVRAGTEGNTVHLASSAMESVRVSQV